MRLAGYRLMANGGKSTIFFSLLARFLSRARSSFSSDMQAAVGPMLAPADLSVVKVTGQGGFSLLTRVVIYQKRLSGICFPPPNRFILFPVNFSEHWAIFGICPKLMVAEGGGGKEKAVD